MAAAKEKETVTYDGKDFQEDYDSEGYLKQFWPGCDPEDPDHDWIITIMRLLHQLFDDEKYRGKSVLDICSGPTIYNVMSASKYFTNIYLCDYAARNREALQKWLSSDPSAHDWSPFFKYAASLEEISGDIIEDRLRGAIKGIFHCDLHNDLPLGKEQQSLTPVDAVFSCFTLEVVVKEEENVADYYKKFHSLLKDGGILMMITLGKVSFYRQNGKTYWVRGFSEKMVREGLIEAGFTDIHKEDIPVAERVIVNNLSDATDYCMYYATKRM